MDGTIKRLVKSIVMSSTYRQSSVISDQQLATDPENIYLCRSKRSRMTAELIKDHIMASSGLLNDEIGGPSVKPYQPKGLWESSTSGRGPTRQIHSGSSTGFVSTRYVYIYQTHGTASIDAYI
jgi:hypothetical protein